MLFRKLGQILQDDCFATKDGCHQSVLFGDLLVSTIVHKKASGDDVFRVHAIP